MSPTPKKFLRFADLKASGRYLNRVTLQRHIDDGLFPAPLPLGPNSNGWDDDKVTIYDEARRAARDAGIRGKADLIAFVKSYVAQAAEAA